MRASFVVMAVVIAVLFATDLNAFGVGSTMYGSDHWFHLIDTDKNGRISRREFLRFWSRTFKRRDTNHDGKLERKELRSLFSGRESQ